MEKWTVTAKVDEYGFPVVTAWSQDGGSFHAADYRSDETSPDKFSYSLTNPHGLGGSHYAQEKSAIIENVWRCVWIPKEIKDTITAALKQWN